MNGVSLDQIPALSVAQRAERQVQQRTVRDDGQTRPAALRQAAFDWLDQKIVQFAPDWIRSCRERDRIVAAGTDVHRGAAAFVLTGKRRRRSYELLQCGPSDIDARAVHDAVRCDR